MAVRKTTASKKAAAAPKRLEISGAIRTTLPRDEKTGRALGGGERQVFVEGDEDALRDAALPAKRLAQLEERGAIRGSKSGN